MCLENQFLREIAKEQIDHRRDKQANPYYSSRRRQKAAGAEQGLRVISCRRRASLKGGVKKDASYWHVARQTINK